MSENTPSIVLDEHLLRDLTAVYSGNVETDSLFAGEITASAEFVKSSGAAATQLVDIESLSRVMDNETRFLTILCFDDDEKVAWTLVSHFSRKGNSVASIPMPELPKLLPEGRQIRRTEADASARSDAITGSFFWVAITTVVIGLVVFLILQSLGLNDLPVQPTQLGQAAITVLTAFFAAWFILRRIMRSRGLARVANEFEAMTPIPK